MGSFRIVDAADALSQEPVLCSLGWVCAEEGHRDDTAICVLNGPSIHGYLWHRTQGDDVQVNVQYTIPSSPIRMRSFNASLWKRITSGYILMAGKKSSAVCVQSTWAPTRGPGRRKNSNNDRRPPQAIRCHQSPTKHITRVPVTSCCCTKQGSFHHHI